MNDSTDPHPITTTLAQLAEFLEVTRSALSARIQRRQARGLWPGETIKQGQGDALQLTDEQVKSLLRKLPRGWQLGEPRPFKKRQRRKT